MRECLNIRKWLWNQKIPQHQDTWGQSPAYIVMTSIVNLCGNIKEGGYLSRLGAHELPRECHLWLAMKETSPQHFVDNWLILFIG